MKVTYLEYYPHYLGTITREVEFDVMDLLSALKAATYEDEEAGDIADALEESVSDQLNNGKRFLYALGSVLVDYNNGANYKKIVNALQKNGVWVGEWEEGTHALALEGKRSQAFQALAAIEAKYKEDEFACEW